MLARNPQYQVRHAQVRLSPRGSVFSHAEACRLFALAVAQAAKQVLIDLQLVEDATTSAFAQMILLRRSLLRTGRDLCLTGLHDRTAGVFEVNRLGAVLPTA